MASEKIYRFDTKRCVSVWLWPFFFTIAIALLFFTKYDSMHRLKAIDIVCWSLLFIFAVVVPGILFFNHLPLAKQTSLSFAGKQLQFTQGSTTTIIRFEEISDIIEYKAYKLPWSFIVKWEIITGDNTFILSSLTISVFSFEQYFWNKINTKNRLFPLVLQSKKFESK